MEQLASIEESLAEVTAIQRKLGISVDEDEDEDEERDLEVCSVDSVRYGPVRYGLFRFVSLVWSGLLAVVGHGVVERERGKERQADSQTRQGNQPSHPSW